MPNTLSILFVTLWDGIYVESLAERHNVWTSVCEIDFDTLTLKGCKGSLQRYPETHPRQRRIKGHLKFTQIFCRIKIQRRPSSLPLPLVFQTIPFRLLIVFALRKHICEFEFDIHLVQFLNCHLNYILCNRNR